MCLYMYVYRCIYRITIYVTFSASGSAGKGSRPVDIGPDYKPPLGGKCCYEAFPFKCSDLWYFRVMRQPTKNSTLFTTQTKSVSITFFSYDGSCAHSRNCYQTSVSCLLCRVFGKNTFPFLFISVLTVDLVLGLVLNACSSAQV